MRRSAWGGFLWRNLPSQNFEQDHDRGHDEARDEEGRDEVASFGLTFGDGAASALGPVRGAVGAEFGGGGHADLFAGRRVACRFVIGAQGGGGGVDEIGLVGTLAAVERVAQGIGGAGLGTLGAASGWGFTDEGDTRCKMMPARPGWIGCAMPMRWRRRPRRC